MIFIAIWTESELKLLKDEIDLNDIDMIEIWNNNIEEEENEKEEKEEKEEEEEKDDRRDNKMEEEEVEEDQQQQHDDDGDGDVYYYNDIDNGERIEENGDRENIEINNNNGISNSSVLSFDLFDKYVTVFIYKYILINIIIIQINEFTEIYTFIFNSKDKNYSIPLSDEEFKRWVKSKGWSDIINKTTRPEYIISSLIYFINDLNITSKEVQYMLGISDNYILVKSIK